MSFMQRVRLCQDRLLRNASAIYQPHHPPCFIFI